MAAEGKFVTRVIYLEDPNLALPVSDKLDSDTRWFDVRPGEDPLVTADNLGRPIAILRLGARLPDASGPDCAFVYGAPPAVVFDAGAKSSRPGPAHAVRRTHASAFSPRSVTGG